MDINKKALEFASYVRNTDEFKNLQKHKLDLEKNKSLKKQLDNYIHQKNDIYSKYDASNARNFLIRLDGKYNDFFKNPVVARYIRSSNEFNTMMEKLYKSIEKELLKK